VSVSKEGPMAGEGRFGDPVPGFVPPVRPKGLTLSGAHVQVEPLRAEGHAADLYRAMRTDDRLWDYLPYGPFPDEVAQRQWMAERESSADPVFFALRDLKTGLCGGVASYLRIAPDMGSIEVGHICLAPEMQGTRAATEAMVLMMGWAFDAGYRRYEWKCDALNLPSRRAATRLGFQYEGTFRQAAIVKGRNRDTAWHSVIDRDWPALRSCFDTWLAPANFDAEGRQRQRLSDLTAALPSG
jgi:RimJ/RimL family protein N-acetyltransferase